MKIRKIEPGDSENIVRWRNQPFVLENFLDRQKLTVEKHNEWYEKMVLSGKVHQFIIVENGRDIGSVFLKNVDFDNFKAEFGIFIGEKEYIGRGYGTTAANLICEYAFSTLHLHKIYLRVLADNLRAIKSYEKVGFIVEGTSMDDSWNGEKFVNVIYMALINHEKKG